MRNRLPTLRREWLLLATIGVLALAVGARAPVFLSWRNGLDIANDSAILAILVMGQMLVLLTRGIDLSVASNLALTGMLCALAGRSFAGLDSALLIALALTVGGLLGSVNGWLITGFGLPPIVVTLGSLAAYRGAVFVASRGAWISDQDIHPAIKALPRAVWLGLPALLWCALLVLALGAIFLRLRKEGRELYALGGNPHAAVCVGIRVAARLRLAYTLSGMLAGLAGLLWVGRYSIAYADLAAGYELTVIAACVIGGVGIGGGVGSVAGAALGVLFIGVVNGALPVIQVSPFWQQAISGAVILVSVALNARAQRRCGRQILEPEGAVA
ncbi:ABC transporter permease [Verminephrobacter aporrectodeae]|uniref:Autoinducer 2 import system permease protein LsrC n=1 Tax=Verminephrobacter aporrectodeae subsp. tuberculatae TaxID=1110392 RepID=A0ABT3KVU1_9BURK|nr:ABC transporter permease [Verminephrobacter aporrectodeae]MCW5222149.1 ABC transporter permease [Verminephrobacter aporrectodeae subsp. tuberculatae]MCW5258476.1 ABC transporter permease [Verminephrobacter aporrectodeae subsp. tuberculatae]MCW5291440.1 ABC transporter permease [Verminephrobacter aporrectodeae subsp. tuberculatae]MCW5322390.1 ABC transporter permease [Verminephrobacter aporrectodeae subsp. tuberculatae]MCW8165086.1 ABC transporter permease [Verminephrobacter aporrectodeae su